MADKLYLYNTLTHREEEFSPEKPPFVGVYSCGPTVYDYQHVGNLRAALFNDLLRRVLEYFGYDVRHITNITDFGHLTSDADTGEDKMMKGLRREGFEVSLEGMRKLALKYEDAYLEDRHRLNIKDSDVFPRASEHIAEQIDLIKKLEEKGAVYQTSDGLYFDTSKDDDYGKLGGVNTEGESRIGENSEKKHPADFVVWKFNSELGWDSPWGKGFPGWHIECSAMSMKYLGETFDIHTGGIEHIPIHHNNEIAQSETATGEEPFVRYWLHNNWLQVNNEKIAKSAGNSIYLKDIEEKGFSPLAFRYFTFGAHYQSEQNFTWEALEGSHNALTRLYNIIETLPKEGGKEDEAYKAKFKEALADNLNAPQALALVWELLRDDSVSPADRYATLLSFDNVLGLDLDKVEKVKVPEEVQKLVAEREVARSEKEFKRADELRQKVENLGFRIKDTDEGPLVTSL